MPLDHDFYLRDTAAVARDLLGMHLVRTLDEGLPLIGRIVEVEAYLGIEDRAAHTFGGRRTPRVESMYLPGGHAYVYTLYGHHCLNLVTRGRDIGEAVLVRALEPVVAMEVMRTRRRGRLTRLRDADLCSGPGKLCQAMGITRELDGCDVTRLGPLYVERPDRAASHDVEMEVEMVAGPRVGVAYAGEWAEAPLRFYFRGNPHVSRPRR